MSTSAQSQNPIAVPLIDLQAQRRRIGGEIDNAIQRVLDHGRYIMGPEVGELEESMSVFTGARNVISCSSGTDALLMALMAKGIGKGDAVFMPAFTFTATAEVVAVLGGTPVFVDVLEDTFNIDPISLEKAIPFAIESSLRPTAIICVDLFGQPADYQRITRIARTHDLFMIADAAQSFGGKLNGKRVGTFGEVTTTSFFPAKPFGCYGDGGAVLTDDDELAERLRSIRAHGKGNDKYDIVRIGVNGRLDTLQAAILLTKLAIFEDELGARQACAGIYHDRLSGIAQTPTLIKGASSAWAQYTIILKNRDVVRKRLGKAGISTAIYYPRPMSSQTAYRNFPVAPGGVPVAERLCRSVLSLPMHPYLEREVQEYVCEEVINSVSAVDLEN